MPLHLLIGYGLGQAVDGCAFNTLNVFGLFYFTAVCGLGGAAAGAALAAGLVLDAVADPFIGAVSDKWRSRWGRRLPLMMLGFPVACVGFAGLFAIPRGLAGSALFAWILALSITLRIAVSVFNLPYQALGAEAADGHSERMRIAAWRWACGMGGGLLCATMGFGYFLAGPEGLLQRAAYARFGLACAGVMALCAIAALATGRALLRRGLFKRPSPEQDRTSFLAALAELFRNRSFRAIFFSAVFFFTALGLSLSLGLHLNRFFWGLSTAQAKVVTLAAFAGLLAGAPLTTPLAVRLEKRTAMLIGANLFVASLALPPLLRLAGLLHMALPRLTLVLAGDTLAGGIAMSMGGVAFAAMMADAADEHELRFGARREAMFFAGWAFAGKAAAGAGTLLAGLVLSLSGFPSGAAAAAAIPVVPAVTVAWLGIAAGPGSGLIALVSVCCILGYRVDRRQHAEMLRHLHSRDVQPLSGPELSPCSP